MIELKTAIIIICIHIGYYLYLQIIADIMRIGMVHNTPNKTIDSFRTCHKVTIKTFQRNSKHYGFAWFKSIYINENLFKHERALRWTLHHEHYHLKKHHKAKILLMRLAFSIIPLMLAFLPWWYFAAVYCTSAIGMEEIRKMFERKANSHASKMTGHD